MREEEEEEEEEGQREGAEEEEEVVVVVGADGVAVKRRRRRRRRAVPSWAEQEAGSIVAASSEEQALEAARAKARAKKKEKVKEKEKEKEQQQQQQQQQQQEEEEEEEQQRVATAAAATAAAAGDGGDTAAGASPEPPAPAGASAVLRTLTAGGLAGCVAKSIVAPLDRVKIMFQVTSGRVFSASAAGREFGRIVGQEGVGALWRGNSAAIARVFPYAGIQFTCYDYYKRLLQQTAAADEGEGGEGSDGAAAAAAGELPPVRRVLAGALAGATSVALTYPLDTLRARFAIQTGKHSRYTGLGSALSSMVREDGGYRTMYRGMSPALLGILPYAGLAFAINDSLRARLHARFGNSASGGGGDEGRPSTVVKLVSGGVSGLVSQTVTYPIDVIRRRMQADGFLKPHQMPQGEGGAAAASAAVVRGAGGAAPATATAAAAPRVVVEAAAAAQQQQQQQQQQQRTYVGIRQTAALIVRNEGWRGLFKGVSMNWLKGPITIGISFTCFDYFKQMLDVQEAREQ